MIEVEKEVNAKGTLCPMPVILAKKAMDQLGKGQVLKLLATDPGSWSDVPGWARVAGFEILQAEEKDGVYTYLVQKP